MSVLLPKIKKLIQEEKHRIERENITPWIMHHASGKGDIKDFHSKKISFVGCAFEGSIRDVFWGRYIEPFLEHFTNRIINEIVQDCENDKLDIRAELDVLANHLRGLFASTYNEMALADQKMRGAGYPEKVETKNVQQEILSMNYYMDQHIAMALNKYKSRNSLRNKLIESFEEHTIAWLATGSVGLIVTALYFIRDQIFTMVF